VQRWEYRVVSVSDGKYTALLNDYAAEGWELQTVAHEVSVVPERREHGLPTPPGFGKIGKVASKLSELEHRGEAGPEPGTVTTRLLWVLRRPVDDDVLQPEHGGST
jgi:hypothetical protein